MAKQTIEQLVSGKGYDDPVLEQAILEDIARLKTADRILSGELVLPHPQDARMWHDRLTGKFGKSEAERNNESRIAELEKRLDEALSHKEGL